MSAVGDDVLGKEAEKQISAFGVKTELLQTVKAKKTGKCLVTLDEKGMPNYNLLNDVAYDFISYDKKIEKYGFDILAFGTLALRNENNRKTLNEIIKNNIFSNKVHCDASANFMPSLNSLSFIHATNFE